jgi:4-amino-4-deoxy-L-arabinose transferase-like glycosyltransferase
VLGNWVFVELMVTKLPHYFLPAYSSLAFLAACAIIRTIRRRHRGLLRWPGMVGAGVWAIAAVVLSAAPWIPAHIGLEIPRAAAAVFTIAAILYAAAVFALFVRRRLAAATFTMGVGVLAVLAIFIAGYLPACGFLRAPRLIGQRLRELGATERSRVALAGIRLHDPAEYAPGGWPAPSLAFYQGGGLRELSDDELASRPPEDWPDWLVITDAAWRSLPADCRGRFEPIASYRAFNYNVPIGIVDVTIMKKK